jgi:hypothetical protein
MSQQAHVASDHQARARLLRRAGVIGMIVCLLPACVGCVGTAEEHVEEPHLRPPHHPESFREAIADIDRRRGALAGGDLEQAVRDRQIQELSDIVGWLPALAAETDLCRREWDRVQAVSRGLSAMLGQGSPASAILDWPALDAAVRDAVLILGQAAATLPADSLEEGSP